MKLTKRGLPKKHGGGLNSKQAKLASRKRWDALPFRMCEVCGREHRCVQVTVASPEEVENAVGTLKELFGQSVRDIVVVKEPEEEKANE